MGMRNIINSLLQKLSDFLDNRLYKKYGRSYEEGKHTIVNGIKYESYYDGATAHFRGRLKTLPEKFLDAPKNKSDIIYFFSKDMRETESSSDRYLERYYYIESEGKEIQRIIIEGGEKIKLKKGMGNIIEYHKYQYVAPCLEVREYENTRGLEELTEEDTELIDNQTPLREYEIKRLDDPNKIRFMGLERKAEVGEVIKHNINGREYEVMYCYSNGLVYGKTEISELPLNIKNAPEPTSKIIEVIAVRNFTDDIANPVISAYTYNNNDDVIFLLKGYGEFYLKRFMNLENGQQKEVASEIVESVIKSREFGQQFDYVVHQGDVESDLSDIDINTLVKAYENKKIEEEINGVKYAGNLSRDILSNKIGEYIASDSDVAQVIHDFGNNTTVYSYSDGEKEESFFCIKDGNVCASTNLFKIEVGEVAKDMYDVKTPFFKSGKGMIEYINNNKNNDAILTANIVGDGKDPKKGTPILHIRPEVEKDKILEAIKTLRKFRGVRDCQFNKVVIGFMDEDGGKYVTLKDYEKMQEER